MMKFIKHLIWTTFTRIDAFLKFPGLKKGEIGIQLGFDMEYPLTSDLFLMQQRVQKTGKVYGIDPDKNKIQKALKIIEANKYPISLLHKAVYSHKGEVELAFGKKPGWNQLKNIPLDHTVEFDDTTALVPMDTLDSIINDEGIDSSKIGHINSTINGSEYYALLGMKELLSSAENLSLTIVAGRYDETGTIDGEADYVKIMRLLNEYGFTCKFKRMHQLFWWGCVVKLLLNRKWVFGKKNYGIVMAGKGTKKLKWYQSFS